MGPCRRFRHSVRGGVVERISASNTLWQWGAWTVGASRFSCAWAFATCSSFIAYMCALCAADGDWPIKIIRLRPAVVIPQAALFRLLVPDAISMSPDTLTATTKGAFLDLLSEVEAAGAW